MTLPTQTTTHEKARGDDTGGFIAFIADFDKATLEQRAQDPSLNRLDGLHELGLPTNHVGNTRFLHDNLSMRDGDSKGEKAENTKGGFGLVMVNNKAEPVNVAAYMPNNDNVAFISDTTQASAYTIGSMSHDSDWWLVTTLSDAVTLYTVLAIDDLNVTVLACLNHSLFDKTLRHFAEVKTINITDTAQYKSTIISRLAGVNAIAHIAPIDSIINRLNEGDLINNLIADTQTIDLAALAWGELGDIADHDSKATSYPIEAWGDEGTILRDAITATAYFSQVPLAMAGQCVLGALANIIQQYVNAPYSDSNDFMPACLFLLTEMASGGGKSKTVSQFSHKELIKYQKERRQEYRTLKAEWEAQKVATPKKDLEAWLLQNPKPKQFILFAKSGTLIGFLDNMLMGNTTDVAWSTAEAALFLSSHSLTSETAKSNVSQICDIWSSGEFDRLLSPRYSTIDEIGMDGVRFTLDLQGQPPIIAPALNDEVMSGQGLLPRFLFAFPDSLNGTLIFNTDERLNARPEADKRLQDYWQRCRELLDPSEGSVKRDKDGRIIRYSMPFEGKEARKALADYRTEREHDLRKGGSLEKYSEYAKRLHENASRIAAIIAYFNGKRFISVDDIQRAIKLTDFSMNERIRYTDKPQAGDNDTQKLLNWLIRYCQKESVNQLAYSTVQSKVIPKALRFKSTFDLLIEVLESENYIKVKVNGRARTIQLRPELLVTN